MRMRSWELYVERNEKKCIIMNHQGEEYARGGRYRDRIDTRAVVYKLYTMWERRRHSAVMDCRIDKIAQSTSSGHRMNKGNSK